MSPNSDPAAVLDISRAPRGELVAARLVAAVTQVGDLAERHYLELKGPPDLDAKVNRQKIAKFILGAANRMPDRAAEAFEGYGVMIIGVTQNGAEGVAPVEMLALSQVIQPFLGATGPRWDIVRLPAESSANQVIVVLVDPPQTGQPPFVCRASGDGLQDGRIYYRADGETREPTSDELDQLMARGAAKPPAPVELDVRVTGTVTPVVVDDERTLEEYITTTRARLLDALPAPKLAPTPEWTLPSASGLAAGRSSDVADAMSMLAADYNTVGRGLSAMLGSEEPEKRTEKAYRAEINTWEKLFRAAWPEGVDLFLSHLPGINEITVANKTQTFLHDVVVELHLDGAVEAIEHEYTPDDGPEWRDLKLPWPPRKWGPTKRAGLGYQPQWAALAAPSHFSPGQFIPSSTSWKNGGSVDVRVNVGDLRPEATFDSDDRESVLVIRGETPSSVRGTWRATARGYNEVFTGTVDVEVAEPAVLTALLREYLGLK